MFPPCSERERSLAETKEPEIWKVDAECPLRADYKDI